MGSTVALYIVPRMIHACRGYTKEFFQPHSRKALKVDARLLNRSAKLIGQFGIEIFEGVVFF